MGIEAAPSDLPEVLRWDSVVPLPGIDSTAGAPDDCHCKAGRDKRKKDEELRQQAQGKPDSQTRMIQGQVGPLVLAHQIDVKTGQEFGTIGLASPGLSASVLHCDNYGEVTGSAFTGSAGVPVAGVAGVQGTASVGSDFASSQVCTGVYVGDPNGVGLAVTFPLTPNVQLPPLPAGYQPVGDGLGSIPPGADMGGLIHLP